MHECQPLELGYAVHQQPANSGDRGACFRFEAAAAAAEAEEEDDGRAWQILLPTRHRIT